MPSCLEAAGQRFCLQADRAWASVVVPNCEISLLPLSFFQTLLSTTPHSPAITRLVVAFLRRCVKRKGSSRAEEYAQELRRGFWRLARLGKV